MNRRVGLDDAPQQRALVHVVETNGRLQCPHQILHHLDVRRADQVGDQFLVGHDEVAEFAGLFIVEPILLNRSHHGTKHLRPKNVGEAVRAVFAQPQHQVGARLVFADQLMKVILETIEMTGVDEHLRQLTRQAQTT